MPHDGGHSGCMGQAQAGLGNMGRSPSGGFCGKEQAGPGARFRTG